MTLGEAWGGGLVDTTRSTSYTDGPARGRGFAKVTESVLYPEPQATLSDSKRGAPSTAQPMLTTGTPPFITGT